MKIALLNNLFTPYERGGAEKVVERLVREKRGEGHQVFLITTKPYGSRPETASDLRIYRLSSFFYNLSLWPFFLRPLWHLGNIFSWRKYRQIRKILGREKPDLVITHNLMGLGFLAPLAIRHLGLKHEHWLHDIQLLHPSGLMILGQEKKISSWSARLYQSLNRLFFASPEKIISPSRWLLEEYERRGFFPASQKEIASRPEHPNPEPRPDGTLKSFLFVGQIEAHKGVLFLISTFKRAADPDARLDIVGDGQELEAAKELAGVDGRIKLRGRLDTAETKKAMALAGWLIVPSLCYENSPTVIHEAQALGLPVLAAAIGGIPEICGPNDSLFRAGDGADLLAKIKNRLDNSSPV